MCISPHPIVTPTIFPTIKPLLTSSIKIEKIASSFKSKAEDLARLVILVSFQPQATTQIISTMSGAVAAEPAPAKDGEGLINLCDMLDKPMCYARNENTSYPLGNLFIGDSRLGMQSDADEQLIIHLTFQEFVKVS